ncbi:fibronectin type-III domain-containing protein [Caerostris darwini]|uniref:Fibronectin type-III domain-containing protein n=1 Tax=Caerostris darwini TaxID=1538125 RepID=A0AAV4VWF2_9ARAC|nr:fibronectin type-III domain-containing protein [Caerostris darwini]
MPFEQHLPAAWEWRELNNHVYWCTDPVSAMSSHLLLKCHLMDRTIQALKVDTSSRNRPIWHTPHMELAHGVIGSSANLTCAAHSQPPPVFEWFREMVLLGNNKLYRISNLKWKSLLQVKIKDASVFGDYHCVVSNSMGKIKRKITLVEGVVPAPPEFSVWSDEPGILIIKFVTIPNAILPVLEYRIEWKLNTDSDWHQARYHQASEGNEFVIHGLSFESEYSIRIAARNTVGYSNYSEEIVQRTKGLIAETVVDGSSVSSSFNSSVSSALRAVIFQHYVILGQEQDITLSTTTVHS